VVGNRVHIGSHSRIGSGVLIEHGVHLHTDTTVPDGGHVPMVPHVRVGDQAKGRPHRKNKGRMAA
jgi:UDP-3-O-[3-hydroxymyristoyl] glucosamine N-acyltransferase